ncbi:MAG TPA: helix-turn-helix domain-containing protein [Solirubrobacterales bacterium]
MHPPEVRAQALALVDAGLNDCEISRRLGIPRGTVRDWRRPTYVPARKTPLETCPRCWRAAKPMRFTPEDYAELLGLYLGDGCISTHPRTDRLRIVLDDKYPGIIEDTRRLLMRCFSQNRVHLTPGSKGKCTAVSLYSIHLVCLFPQHGPGPKHARPILLEPWQQNLVECAPWAFLRGCIRSDGSVFINRTDIHRTRPYEYLSYDFSNRSKDVVDLFTTACGLTGVRDYRVSGAPGRRWSVRINRRASVALMLEHVGLKA